MVASTGASARSAIAGDDVALRVVGGDLITLLHMVQLTVISHDPVVRARRSRHRRLDFARSQSDRRRPPSPCADVAAGARRARAARRRRAHLKTSGARGASTDAAGDAVRGRAAVLPPDGVDPAAACRRSNHAAPEDTAPAASFSSIVCRTGLGKTLASAYSARASVAGVSTPLTWAELDAGTSTRAISRCARCRRGCVTWAISGRACARRRGSIWTPRSNVPTEARVNREVKASPTRAGPERW